MLQKATEAFFTIALVGLVLLHGNAFASVIGTLGSNYQNTVRGLQPSFGQFHGRF
jgi:hypothetical protein